MLVAALFSNIIWHYCEQKHFLFASLIMNLSGCLSKYTNFMSSESWCLHGCMTLWSEFHCHCQLVKVKWSSVRGEFWLNRLVPMASSMLTVMHGRRQGGAKGALPPALSLAVQRFAPSRQNPAGSHAYFYDLILTHCGLLKCMRTCFYYCYIARLWVTFYLFLIYLLPSWLQVYLPRHVNSFSSC